MRLKFAFIHIHKSGAKFIPYQMVVLVKTSFQYNKFLQENKASVHSAFSTDVCPFQQVER